MNIEIERYSNVWLSPAQPLILEHLAELQSSGFSQPRNLGVAWDDPALIATIDDEVAGFMVYRSGQGRGVWYIMAAHTVARFRRKGVHTALFSALVSRAKSRGDILAIESGTHVANISAQRSIEAQGRVVESLHYTFHIRDFEPVVPLLESAGNK